jgi:hypothetical protein
MPRSHTRCGSDDTQFAIPFWLLTVLHAMLEQRSLADAPKAFNRLRNHHTLLLGVVDMTLDQREERLARTPYLPDVCGRLVLDISKALVNLRPKNLSLKWA